MKTTFSLLLLVLPLWVCAQHQHKMVVKVEEKSMVLAGVSRTGMSTVLELDYDDVEKAWLKKLKDYGKYTSEKGVYTVESCVIPSISSTAVRIISTVVKTSKGAEVFWAIDMGTSYVSRTTPKEFTEASKILHDFGVQCYIDDINEQIKEAESVLSTSVKNQEKLANNGENLQKNVDSNRKKKKEYEQNIIDLDKEYDQLLKDIEQNKMDQTAAAQEVERLKKALESVKSKLTLVE